MSEIPPATPPQVPTDPPATPAPRKRRWRRWLIIGVGGTLVFGVIGVLLLPTILSLSPVRATVMGIAGPKIAPNGSIAINDWAFSWTGGQSINGITLYDDQKAAVAHLNVRTGASLLALARGNYDLKQTDVTGDFDVRIDPATGRVNVLHILGADDTSNKKPKAKKTDKASTPSKLPDVSGKLHVAMTGTISSTDPRGAKIPFTKVETADFDVDLTKLNDGVGLDGTIAATVDGKPARLAIKGSVDAIDNNVIVSDLNKIGSNLKVTIDQVDLALVKVAMAASAAMKGETPPDLDLAGVAKGVLTIDVTSGGPATIASDALGVDGLRLNSPALKGDTLALDRVDLPLRATRDAASAVWTIQDTGIRSDVATVAVGGSLPQSAIQNLIDQKPPGAAGQIVVKTDVPKLAAVAAMLPNTLGLKQGVEVTGGALSDELTLDVLADGAKVANSLKVNAAGRSDGKAITLDETTLDAGGTLAFVEGVPIGIKSIRQANVDLRSPFATVKGGGPLGALKLDGNADLGKLVDNVGQFVALDGLDLKGTATFALATDGDITDLSKPLAAKLDLDAVDLVMTNKGESLLDNVAIKGNVDVLYRETKTARLITAKQFNLGTKSGLFGLWTAGDAAWVSLPIAKAGEPIAAGSIGGEGEFHLRTSDLPRVLKLAGIEPDADSRVERGVVDAILNLATTPAGDGYTLAMKTDVSKLDVGKAIGNESLTLTANATLPANLQTATGDFALASAFANVSGKIDAHLKNDDGSAVPTLAVVRSATIDGDVPSVEKLYKLATSISPPAVTNDAKTGKPLPPMNLNGGSMKFAATVSRDEAKQLTRVAVDVPGIRDLTISRGEQSYAIDKPITFKTTADLTTDTTKKDVLDQITRAIATITLDAPGLAMVTTPTPIEVTNLSSATPAAKGVIKSAASLGEVFRLLAAIGGGEPTAISGDWTSEQALSSDAKGLKLVGGGTIGNLASTATDAKPFPEAMRKVQLTNDVSADLKNKAISIAKVEVFAPEARDALSLSLTGGVRDLGTTNTIDTLRAVAKYDAPQLWLLLQPIVDPTGESIGRVEDLEGKYEKAFTISGSYPTATADGTPVPANDAIRSLVVAGEVEMKKATLVDKGVELANLVLPIRLRDGVASVLTAKGKSPTPFDVNGGKGDLGGLAVNLVGDEPILGDVKQKTLIRGATLNPVLSNALGKYFNPIFPNASKATANIDLVLSSTGLHLGKSLTTSQSGRATVVLSLTNLVIRNPLSEQLLGKAVNGFSSVFNLGGVDTSDLSDLHGEMKDATFTLDRGVVTQDATFMVGDAKKKDAEGKTEMYAFNFAGDVRLDTLKMDLTAGFPMRLLKDKLGGDAGEILAYAPDRFTFGIAGTTTSPKPDLGGLSKLVTEAAAKYGASRLIKGDKADGGKKSDVEKGIDILGGLLDKNKRK